MIIIPANTISGGYEVANSLRFNDGSSDYLVRTPSSQGNLQISTFSVWIKRSNISSGQQLFYTGDPDTAGSNFGITLTGADTLHVETDSPSLVTSRKFRDVSAWYHIVVAIDTTQSTSSNRVKIYVNGVQETSFGTEQYPSQNANLNFNKTVAHHLGALKPPTYGEYYDGYMTEVCWIDGQQLTPTSFGEFDEDTGIWKPIDVSDLTFGTNGFYLDFENSSSLGADVSGNGNNFTVNNLTSIDQTTDTCTNNFITMNPLNATLGGATFSEGNLKVALSNGNYQAFGTIQVTQGKWYWEQKVISSSLFSSVADGNRATEDTGTGLLNREYAWGYRSDGVKQHDGATASYGNSFTTNDIIGVALDMDNGFIYFSKNGTWQNSGDPTSGASGTGSAYSGLNTDSGAPNGLTPCLGQFDQAQTSEWNFGSPPYSISSGNSDGNGYGNFEYAVPSGYYALNTKNLAEYG